MQPLAPRPLALTDRQMHFVQQSAKSLPVNKRDEFLRYVGEHLSGEPTDADVTSAVNAALDHLPQRYAFCDGKPPEFDK